MNSVSENNTIEYKSGLKKLELSGITEAYECNYS
jgi:hypothetical protein